MLNLLLLVEFWLKITKQTCAVSFIILTNLLYVTHDERSRRYSIGTIILLKPSISQLPVNVHILVRPHPFGRIVVIHLTAFRVCHFIIVIEDWPSSYWSDYLPAFTNKCTFLQGMVNGLTAPHLRVSPRTVMWVQNVTSLAFILVPLSAVFWVPPDLYCCFWATSWRSPP